MKRYIAPLIILVAVVAGTAFVFWSVLHNVESVEEIDVPAVGTFDQCAQAGYAIMESYPQQCRTPDGRSFTQDIGNELEKIDSIVTDAPRPNSTIKSPLMIKGQARGFWFFEATFPIRLEDSDGNVLAESFAQALDDWMTEEFVSFEAELEFDPGSAVKGNLFLERSNPSALPENDEFLRIPVNF